MTAGQSNTLGALLHRSAQLYAERVVFVSDRERHTYEVLWQEALDHAAALKALGVQPGDHVGIAMPNTFEFASLFFGVAILGAVSVPLNVRYNAQELRFVIENADLTTLCVMSSAGGDRDLVQRLHESFPGLKSAADAERLDLAEAPRLRRIVSFNGHEPGSGLVSRRQLQERARTISVDLLHRNMTAVQEHDPAVICYTSGTSANPKGCVLSHHAMVAGWIAGGARLKLKRDDIVWSPCPLYHLSSLGPLTFVVEKGAALLTAEYFEPASALALLRAEKPTIWYTAVTSIPSALFDLPGYRKEDFAEARFMINAGPTDLLQALQSQFLGNSMTSYGMTEAAGLATSCEPGGSLEDRTCNVGRPVDGMEVRIVDPETGQVLAAEQPGEIQFRGTVFDGYYRNPESTAQTKDAEGWCRSGDAGKLSAEGKLIYLSRLKDMLKVGGENVAPVEIEKCLATHPAVKLAQVVGIPDRRLGEVPFAFVEKKSGAVASEAELLAHCEHHLARFKRPREVRFVTQWPQSITLGKIQKAALREIAQAAVDGKELNNAN